jgi:GDP-4-dehydro-6-deoxy-D-mannose reductase
MKQRALVTGAEGFVGDYLSKHLQAESWDVIGSTLAHDEAHPERIVCDIRQADQVNALVQQAGAVTHVFHLAAVTYVPDASRDPSLAIDVNLGGTINVATALRDHAPDAHLIYIASGEVYGIPTTLPLNEDCPLNPANPYAITKTAADHFCAYLSSSNQLQVTRVRPFNHTGPGQPPNFVLPAFARQIARIEQGKQPPIIEVGNLDAKRDFLHVADVVRAYEKIATHGKPGEAYNICSGKSWSIRQALDDLLKLSDATIDIHIDQSRLRPSDIPDLCGSHDKLTQQTQWTPEIPFETLLAELLDYWRGQES